MIDRMVRWMTLVLMFLAPAVTAMDAYYVDHVIDGDTVILENKRPLRYIGVDAPEIFHQKNLAQAFGYASRDFNRHLIGKQKIRLEYDREKSDRYGRLLAYVYNHKDRCINRLLLLEGYATYLYLAPNSQRHQQFLEDQRRAMAEGRGLWSRWADDGGALVGNLRSKRFHLITCPYGRRIGKQNQLEFKNRWEAFWEGFAPCRQCMPVRDPVGP